MTSLADRGVREAGALFRAGRLSPVELTEAVLARADATEPTVRAYVALFHDAAMAAARAAEEELRLSVDRGPLHGIPVAVKDVFDVEGVPTRCGSEVRRGAPPAVADADAVARLRAGGAVIVGKTVTHEFAGGVLSPPTRNPWDPTRIPGGSSGGSAVAVAAGSCLVALGTDTAGSIRIPAALTGTVGLKPTVGLVGNRGVFPLSWSLDTVGPLARSVDDAMLVLAVIAGDGRPLGNDSPTSTGQDDLRGVRLGVPRHYFFEHLQPEVAAAVERAIAVLVGLGAEAVETPWPEARAASAAGFVIVRPEMAAVHGETLRATPELFGPVLRARLEAFALFPAKGYLRARQARSVLGRAIAELYRAHRLDALVMPTAAATATPADRTTIAFPDGEEPIHAGFTRLTMPFNTVGLPAFSVPCGFDSDTLPIGLQIVGTTRGERSLARIAEAYERAAGWSERRPPL